MVQLCTALSVLSMMRVLRAALTLLLTGCSGSSGEPATGDGGSGDGDSTSGEPDGPDGTGEPTGDETGSDPGAPGFAEPAQSVSLPEIYGMDEFDTLAGSVVCNAGSSFTHLLTDMDGDARPDLVVTDRCDGEGVGTEHWLVFGGDGAGFVADAQVWALPAMFGQDQWNVSALAAECDDSEGYAHALMDIDGDGRPDLVVADACDALDVGTSHWLVFDGQAGGFAGQARQHALPRIFGEEEFDTIANSLRCANDEYFTHQLVDLNADGRPDLVVTDRCDEAEVGTSHWLVFEGGDDGFTDAPIEWSLPELFGAEELDQISRFDECDAGGHFGLTLADLDGDRRPDLIVTDACDEVGTGTDRWLVAPNTGMGFADDWDDWALPSVFEHDELEMVAGAGTCAGGEQLRHQLVDLGGDGLPELVVTDACDATGVGTTSWWVFANDGDGFAGEASDWSIPDVFGMDEFDSAAGSVECDEGGSFTHGLADLDGDAALDLVITDRCDETGVGTTHWAVYRG